MLINKNLRNYLVTLFARFFIVFSGFVVFLVTSYLFGPEGRGIIGLGTSIVSFFGLIFSFNLGRSFLNLTKRNKKLKKIFLPEFIALNYLMILITVLVLIFYYAFNNHLNLIIDFDLLIAFCILSPFYVWSVNGSDIYASLNKTNIQDITILIIRLLLILMTLFFYIFNFFELNSFIYFYSSILGFGALLEISILGKPTLSINFKKIYNYISDSIIAHIDYLSLVLYPLIVVIMAAYFLSLFDLGNLNFAFQLIYFVFTFSFVASLKMKSYIATQGMLSNLLAIKKLLLYTFIFSYILVFVIYIIISSSFFINKFPGFANVACYFLILSISIPGYMIYHFLYPVLIEYDLIHHSMKYNLIALILSCFISYLLLNLYGILGACFSLSLFFVLIFIINVYLYKKLKYLII
jgi:O-antigen/teichoic acid export membrane protein